ncbi:hypothetical protein Ahia01_000914500 [Argonauta hians]
MSAKIKSLSGDSDDSKLGLNVESALDISFDGRSWEEMADLKQQLNDFIDQQQAALSYLQGEIDYITLLNERHAQISSNTEEQTLSEVEEAVISKLNDQISMTRGMTGIDVDLKLQAYSIKDIDAFSIVKYYKLHLLCKDKLVKIVVELKIDTREANKNYQVKNLQIRLKDKEMAETVHDTLEQLEKSNDLVDAVRFLSSYSWMLDERTTAFSNLQQSEDTAPFVSFPGETSGDTIVIFDPEWRKVKISVKWTIESNLMFLAESDLSISCRVASSSIKADFLNNLPEVFSQLIAKEGREGALRCLVKMVRA